MFRRNKKFSFSATKILMSKHQHILSNVPEKTNGDENVTKNKKFVSKNRHDLLKAKYKCLKKLFQVYDASIISILPPNTSDDNSFEQADYSSHGIEQTRKSTKTKHGSRTKVDASICTIGETGGENNIIRNDSKPIEASFLEDAKIKLQRSCATQVAPSILKEDKTESENFRDNPSITIMDECGTNFYSTSAITNWATTQPRKLTRFQMFLYRLFGTRRETSFTSPLSHNAASDYDVCHSYAYREKRRRKGFRCRRVSLPKKTHSDIQRHTNYPPILEYVQKMQKNCLLDKTPRTCPITGCDKIFYGILNYNDHLNLCHFNDRKFICHYCHEGFKHTCDKNAHENEHLGITAIDNNSKHCSNIVDVKNNISRNSSNNLDVENNNSRYLSNILNDKNDNSQNRSNILDVKNDISRNCSNILDVKRNNATNCSNSLDIENDSSTNLSNIVDIRNSLTNCSKRPVVENKNSTNKNNIPDVKRNNSTILSNRLDVKNQCYRSCITQTEAEILSCNKQEEKLKKIVDFVDFCTIRDVKNIENSRNFSNILDIQRNNTNFDKISDNSQNFEVIKPGRSDTNLLNNKLDRDSDKKTVSCTNFSDKLKFVNLPLELNDSGLSACPCGSLPSKCHCCGQHKKCENRGQLHLHTESRHEKQKMFPKLHSYVGIGEWRRKYTLKHVSQNTCRTHNRVKLKTGKIDIQTRHSVLQDQIETSFATTETCCEVSQEKCEANVKSNIHKESKDTWKKESINNFIDKRKGITVYRWEPGTKIIRV